MTDVLVTGGTGHLGRDLVELLIERGHRVRVLARNPGQRTDVEWIRADLATTEDFGAAVSGIHTVVHAATNSPAAQRGKIRLDDMFRSPSDVDVEATSRLLGAAARSGVAHFCHVSIVGAQDSTLPYMRRKAQAEDLVRGSAMPWSIVGATGFYWLLTRMFDTMAGQRIWPVPSNLAMQACDSAEFAEYLAECVDEGPAGDRSAFGGPEVVPMAELARQYLTARGLNRRIVGIRLPGFALRKAGPQTCPDGRHGKFTWAQWLAAH